MRRTILMMACLLVAGCHQGYYKVTDLQSGKEFYTKGWLDGMYGRNSQLHLKELGSDHEVVVQSSHVEEVTKE